MKISSISSPKVGYIIGAFMFSGSQTKRFDIQVLICSGDRFGNHILTSQDNSKFGHLRSYLLNLSLRKSSISSHLIASGCFLSYSSPGKRVEDFFVLLWTLMFWTAIKEVFAIWLLSWPSSGPELCIVWLWNMPASGWGSLWESSSCVPWFVPYAFRDVSRAVPYWPWISGFMRKSSRRDSAPKKRFFVFLNSWDNFFVTLPSISSETWVM